MGLDDGALNRVRVCLEGARRPLWESELLRAAWPDESFHDWPALELYRRHFHLFASLYALGTDYYQAGFYLHVHFMRTSLCQLPNDGSCAWFFPEDGRFCGRELPCDLHGSGNTALPSPADSRSFYADPSNIDWLDGASAEALGRNAWDLLCSWPRAEAAWRTLGLEPGTPLDRSRQRYRELVRLNHPDVAGENHDASSAAFLKIQDAWQVLCEVLPLLG